MILASARTQIAEYLSTLGGNYPKNLDQMIERSNKFNATRTDGAGPNPSRWVLFKREADSGSLEDYRYTSVRDYGLPMIRAITRAAATHRPPSVGF